MIVDSIMRLSKFDTATVANAIEQTGTSPPTEGFGSIDLRCQFPELPAMVGLAVTCTHDSTSPERRPSRLHDLIDAIEAASASGPVVVVCQYAGTQRERGCFMGDMFARLIQRLGGVGVVTDTGVRDLKGIGQRAPGLQVFAAGCVPSHGLPSIVEVGSPVCLGGLELSPGDLVHGDLNGVVRIPPAAAALVSEEAARVAAAEQQVFRLLEQEPLPLAELKAKLFRHGYH